MAAAPSRSRSTAGSLSSISPSGRRSGSQTRLSLSTSVPYSTDRTIENPASASSVRRRICACSPTSHPGSFRCSLHRGSQLRRQHCSGDGEAPSRMVFRRSTLANSVARWSLAALIRPSSHQIRRRAAFQPRPSRLSIMSCAADLP